MKAQAEILGFQGESIAIRDLLLVEVEKLSNKEKGEGVKAALGE